MQGHLKMINVISKRIFYRVNFIASAHQSSSHIICQSFLFDSQIHKINLYTNIKQNIDAHTPNTVFIVVVVVVVELLVFNTSFV